MSHRTYSLINRKRINGPLVLLVAATLTLPSALSWTLTASARGQETSAQADSFAPQRRKAKADKDKSGKEGKRIFLEARDLIAEEDWEGAEELFSQYVRAYPQADNLDAALYWLAFSRKRQSKFQEAETALARIFSEFPRSSWANDARAMRIEIATERGDRRAIEAASETSNGNEELKLVALQGLFDANTERALELAADALKSNSTASTEIKEAVLMLLGTHAGDIDKAVSLLSDAARTSGNKRLQRAAIFGLGQADDERSFALLRELATSTDTDAARTAVLALSQSSRSEARAVLLEIGRSSPSNELRREAILMLGQGGRDEAIDELLKLFDTSQEVETKKAIVLALSQSGDERAIARLREIVRKEPNTEVRREAIIMLSQTNGARSVETLIELYDAETNPSVKESIITALAQANGKGALQKLIEIARRDKSVELRKQAIFWLGQSGDPEARKTIEDILKLKP